jgi:hypothetical protein
MAAPFESSLGSNLRFPACVHCPAFWHELGTAVSLAAILRPRPERAPSAFTLSIIRAGFYPGDIPTTISSMVAIPEPQARELMREVVDLTNEAQRAEANAALESARRYLESVREREKSADAVNMDAAPGSV